MSPWVRPHILVTSPWDPPLTLAWEATRALGWDTVDPALVITAWEAPVQSILAWEAPLLAIRPWEVPALYIQGWEALALYTQAWEVLGHSQCPLRKSILQTNPWFSTHRTPTLLLFTLVVSVIKRSMTTTR